MRKPWFSIIEVTESHGRSMADIAADVIKARMSSLQAVRGERRDRFIVSVRHEIIARLRAERADLPSHYVARFLKRDPSTIRHYWREMAA